jgi:hypothetical protein
VIATDQRINGHQYQIAWVHGHATVGPRCSDPCPWTGTPWRPEQGSPARIYEAAREWHENTATAAPITREEIAS